MKFMPYMRILVVMSVIEVYPRFKGYNGPVISS